VILRSDVASCLPAARYYAGRMLPGVVDSGSHHWGKLLASRAMAAHQDAELVKQAWPLRLAGRHSAVGLPVTPIAFLFLCQQSLITNVYPIFRSWSDRFWRIWHVGSLYTR
jgi:hypothetical protein